MDRDSVSREDETVMEKVEWENIGKYGKKNTHKEALQPLYTLLVCLAFEKKSTLGQLEVSQI